MVGLLVWACLRESANCDYSSIKRTVIRNGDKIDDVLDVRYFLFLNIIIE